MYEDEDVKLCSTCEELKPLSEFHKRSSSKDGHIGQCKPCRSANRNDYWHVAMDERFNRANITENDVRRFQSFLELDDNGCLLWTGAVNPQGYPEFYWVCGRIRAHRFSLLAAGVEFDVTDDIHHLCHSVHENGGSRRCVNWQHLEPLPRGLHQRIHAQERKNKPSARERLDRFSASRRPPTYGVPSRRSQRVGE